MTVTIIWIDAPKCSFGIYGDEWYFVTKGTASSYLEQIEGRRSEAWHAMSSTRSVSMVDYPDRDVAKKACEDNP